MFRRITTLLTLPFLLSLHAPAFADRPEAPVILDLSAGTCTPAPEICGDGIDQDCDGRDTSCDLPIGSGLDADLDGYPSNLDCNDNERKVYPGITVACEAAGCGTGWQQCQTNGQFSACSCTPLCEATGSGSCFYISKLTGNDSNPGTFNQPWKTLAPIFHYRCLPEQQDPNCPGDYPAPGITRRAPRAGDVIYLMSGVYDESWDVEGQRFALYLREIRGTAQTPIVIKSYPGASPTISPRQQATGMFFLNSEHVRVEGLEVARSYQNGVYMSEVNNFEFRNMWIHSTDGVDNNNLAGFHTVQAYNWSLHHSLIHDNYDRTNADSGGERTENSRNIVLFRGGNARIHHNVIFQTPPTSAAKTGSCLVQKHGLDLPGGTLEVDHNIFRNCWFAAIGTCSYGGRFHHNLFIDSEESVSIRNHGGPPIFKDNIIEYNTMVNTPALRLEPSNAYEINGEVGLLRYRYNVVSDNRGYNADEGGIHRIDPYGSVSVYNWFTANATLEIDSNCYYNPNHTVRFAYFSNISQGGLYTFSQWQGRGFDTSSFVTNPNFAANYSPQNASCRNFGHLANW